VTNPEPREKSEKESCAEGAKKEFLLDTIKTHIEERHGPKATRTGRNGVFDASFFKTELWDVYQNALFAPTHTDNPPKNGVAECLHSYHQGKRIGVDPEGRATQTFAVAFDMDGYIRTIYPCRQEEVFGCDFKHPDG
jgi:hypothetical protein